MPEGRPLRVLHVITRLILGGAQENTLLTCEGLDRMAEYDVTLATGVDRGPEGNMFDRAEKSIKLVVIPELGRNINPVADFVALVKLYRHIRRNRYHIVHTHSSKAGVLGRIAAKLAGTPIVIHTLHGLVFHEYQPWIVNRTWRLVKKICAPMTDHFLSVSSIIIDKAVAAGIDRREKFTTVYSGMELDWFLNSKADGAAVRRELGIPKDAPVVGKIARLFPLKGHNELMDAAPEIVRRQPDVRFLLIGDGILYDHLRERAARAGILENFVFAGLMKRERIPEMIAAMDVVVHTSLREGLARVLPQALAMGKPCVSFDIDGAPEVVIDGETGYLVRAHDYETLADRISSLLADPGLRARMGENGRRHVDPRWRAETMVAETARIYAMLTERLRGRLDAFDAFSNREKGGTIAAGST
ncbi:MAG TPA: glycosyltransferase family 4 protein [Thermoanaerobaculia bacterium]|jgi:glycosyltransferase involved in cell wall biosynthesis|nr:glycosyltransferase family 4 protein [Thermoanaerobaculia bacterium]